MTYCVGKCCERNLQCGMSGKFRGEFIPGWIRQDLKKQKQCCCVPGDGNTSECSSELVSFEIICEAANVNVSEEEVTNDSGPFNLCSQHYYAASSQSRSVSECTLCSGKNRHRAGS